MKFLTEQIESVETLIEEGVDGKGKSYFISGPFMQSEQKNRNGRIYPKSVLEGQMGHQLTLIREKRALGELNHPNTPNVSLEKASHLITELKWSGNDVLGKARLLDTPMGKIAKTLVDEGVKFGVSTRGMGSVKSKNGINEVQNDFKLICVDLVSDPSGPDCWVEGLMEGAEWVLNPINGLWEQRLTQEVEAAVRSHSLDFGRKVELFEKYFGAIQELSNKTLASYAKKAVKSKDEIEDSAERDSLRSKSYIGKSDKLADKYSEKADKKFIKSDKRYHGIMTALDKLSK